MLAGTLVTAIGLMPVGFAKSSAGEYAGNIFWVVMFALLTSWVVAVAFTPYIGVKLLPDIAKVEGGVMVRDSKNPDHAPLKFTPEEWLAFVAGVNQGEFSF
jgi:multidrug efflux pump subunit AcrB